MGREKYPHLFEPLRLNGTLFKNRIFAAPTGYRNSTYDSSFPIESSYYYGRKAMGGAAAVSTGEIVVDSEYGSGSPFHVKADDARSRIPLGKIAAEIARYGSVPIAEFQHAGMYANRDLAIFGGASTGEAYGPVEMELKGRNVKAMDEAMSERTIAKYASAAANAKSQGYGMVMIHAGHGWLLHQFLSGQINTRKDKWGGPDIENRARFTVEILKAVRKAVGLRYPIEVRISGSECYDGGYGIEDGIDFARILDDYVDLIHVSVGSHEVREVFSRTHPSMFLGEAPNVEFAAEIKKHIRTPVATVGAIGDPEMMEDIIASGKSDVVELARSLIADPDIPNKISVGKEDEIMPCMRCLYCFSSQMNLGVKYCPVNPDSGREHETKYALTEAKVKKSVLVVGGGMGGMEAALSCNARGHKVILCEKSGELGGAIRCERNVPFKTKLEQYIGTQELLLKRSEVELRLHTEVRPKYAEEIGADVIIAALGATPVLPAIDGIETDHCFSAETVYNDPACCGQRVIILGAGLVGLELAVYLAILGRSVSVVEMADKVTDGGNMLHMQALMLEIEKYHIDIRFSARAKQIEASGISLDTEGGEIFIPADTVIYAVGQSSNADAALSLRNCADEFYMIGDCNAVGNIAGATGPARGIAINIGRY
jgi:2,4-dienoyl-CoA reductase-like NADH-dependent reductase (Old Yellow Enzyme family)/thioredoxin reductase